MLIITKKDVETTGLGHCLYLFFTYQFHVIFRDLFLSPRRDCYIQISLSL